MTTTIAVVVTAGVVLRIMMLLHNRNLIIDEANIVRNVAERDFAGLTRPLSYEQYAPPVFLWIEKGISLFAGYGEKAMRCYSLVCGLGVLLLFPAIGRRLQLGGAILLPLCYLAFGLIFIKYSAEVKQYMPDAFIALALVLFALKLDVSRTRRLKFTLFWILAGTLAIWASMPAIFILAGVGLYYGVVLLKKGQEKRLSVIILITGCWMAQFAVYYFNMLRDQANSSYLQAFHKEYFLTALPASTADLQHNWSRLEDILGNLGGWTGMAIVTNLLLLIFGIVHLFRTRRIEGLLIGVPILLVLVAAAMHQFTLIDRVILFILPLWLLLIAFGVQYLWRFPLAVKAVLVVICLYNAGSYAFSRLKAEPYESFEITRGMDWIIARGGTGRNLAVHHACVPTFLYYTELHPDRQKRSRLLRAECMQWATDYRDFGLAQKDTLYLLTAGGMGGEEALVRVPKLKEVMVQTAYYKHAACEVFVFVPQTKTFR